MLKIQRFFTKALASMMLAGLCCCFSASVSKAQCPTNINPLPGGLIPGWTGLNTDIIHRGTCTITVTYCTRLIPNWPTTGTYTRQIFLTGISDNGDASCFDINTEIQIANDQLVTDLNADAPPCGYSSYRVETSRNACWKKTASNPNAFSGGGCGNAVCMMACDLCYSYGQVHRSNCTFSNQGDLGECSVTRTDPWTVDGNCYLLPCPTNP